MHCVFNRKDSCELHLYNFAYFPSLKLNNIV
jgi:hypothetical protein